MNIAVLGTGMVGRAIAGRLAELGHQVVIGTLEPGETLARTGHDQMARLAMLYTARRCRKHCRQRRKQERRSSMLTGNCTAIQSEKNLIRFRCA